MMIILKNAFKEKVIAKKYRKYYNNLLRSLKSQRDNYSVEDKNYLSNVM